MRHWSAFIVTITVAMPAMAAIHVPATLCGFIDRYCSDSVVHPGHLTCTYDMSISPRSGISLVRGAKNNVNLNQFVGKNIFVKGHVASDDPYKFIVSEAQIVNSCEGSTRP